MSKEKVVKKVKEGGNFYHPSKNIITKEKNKIKNINIKTSEDITPDDGTLQDDEVESVYLSFSDDDWLNYEVKRSMTDEVNNNLKLNDMKKENEMSDNGTNAMNAISEQSERQARENESSGCGKENEMATSTSGDKNNTSKGEHNVPVVNPKDKIIPRPAPAPQTQNKATGEPQNVSVDNLSTQDNKTQPEPRECPQNETDVFKRISEILEEALVITDVEPFKAKLQEALDLLKQVRPSANRNAFTRCCDDTIYWYTQNNWDDLDMFFVASDFKRDIERMKRA